MHLLRIFGIFLIVAGVVITFSSTILPFVKIPQTFVKKGPSVKLDETTTYWIDTWVLPPIDAGTPFSVELIGAHPGGLTIAVLPSQDSETIPNSRPLLTNVFNSTQNRLYISTTTSVSSQYTVFIVSIRNNFTLTINSRWSPFYNLRVYLYCGIGAIPAGLLVIYYWKIREERERVIREALKADRR